MNFDKVIDKRGQGAAKWDAMESYLGVSPNGGLAMWVADMDFELAPHITRAAQDLLTTGHMGYFTGVESYHAAISWWMQTRHDWALDPAHILTTAGLGNGIALTLSALTAPGDEVIIFTPVYHEFRRKIAAAGRTPVEFQMTEAEGQFELNFDDYEARLSGRERAVLFSSPHNPGGRVWTAAELHGLAAFCARNDLILICDEIHHDLVFPGQKHIAMPNAAPALMDRVVMMTAPSKSFNIAGLRNGNVIIPNDDLRARVSAQLDALNLQPNLFGMKLTEAAYSPEGADWIDALNPYLAANAALFNGALSAIPGVRAMPMQGTYLAWVNFEGTGMAIDEIKRRVMKEARIAPTPGADLGPGGELCLRFNLGTRRAVVQEAAERLTAAFSDLQ